MKLMFAFCPSFIGDGIGNWNTVNVTIMGGMFAFCTSFTGAGIKNWNTGNVTNMDSMLYGSGFDTDISGWNLSQVNNMNNMFDNTPLTEANYSNILIGWAVPNSGGTIPTGITLGAQGCHYNNNAISARDSLINDYQWQIVGDISPNQSSTIVLQFDSIPPGAEFQ